MTPTPNQSPIEYIGCPKQLEEMLSTTFGQKYGLGDYVIKIYGPDALMTEISTSPDAYNVLITDNMPAPELGELFSDIWFLPLNECEVTYRIKMFMRRVELENQVAQDRALIKNLTDSSPNLIWIKDLEGRHTFVNESFCRAVGKPREIVQGKTHAFIWDVEEDDPACLESEQIVIETGQTYISEEAIQSGGEERLLSVHKAPLRDARGQISGTLGIAIDITREREYRNYLLQSGAALDAMFTSLDCGVIYHGKDLNIYDLNRAALAILGIPTLKELQDRNFTNLMDIIVPQDRERIKQILRGIEYGEPPIGYKFTLITSTGQNRYIFGKTRLIQDEGALTYRTYLLDCTEQIRKQAQESAERTAVQTELIHALGADYQILFWRDLKSGDDKIFRIEDKKNRRLDNIFLGSANLHEKLEDYITTWVHPEDQQRFRNACSIESLTEELKDKTTGYYNYRLIVNGKINYCQMKVARVGREDLYGFVIGLLNVDVQTRREMEDKERLAAALQEAKRASQAKSTFLSNMSHDIRTPLNAIVGYTSLAARRVEDDPYLSSHLGKVLNSGKHLISLINDILDMSHIESGKMKLTEEPCKIGDILEEISNIVTPAAKAKSHELEIFAQEIPEQPIWCDRLHLEQVLLNLITNAIKYTPAHGRIEIHVNQVQKTETNTLLEFRIRDNGIGMAEEFLSKIFEPFERERTSTVAGIQGTGLGMAIAKNITEMMGGKLCVESHPGVGTEFQVKISFRMAPEIEAEEENTGTKATGGGHLLLAEDNEMNQEIAVEFLTGAGYTVDVANNGLEAIEKLQDHRDYDLVLMDVQMPVMDGYAAVRAIRSLPDAALASIPVLAMTANSFEEDRQEALRNGMNGHITKPIDFKKLFNTLDSFLSR